MSMNRVGFTLIELIIAISIAGMMSVILFQSLFQINKTTMITDKVMTVNEKAERLTQLFDHDLAGATTLVDNKPPKNLETDMKQTSTTSSKQQPQKKAPPQEKEEEEKPQKKIIKKIFNSTNSGERLDTLTFISNNPMASYWQSKHGSTSAGKPKPNLVRITYILKEDPENKNSYILTRQESIDLEWEKRSGKTYEVMTGIKEISVEYTAKIEKTITIEEEEKTKKDDTKAKTQQPQQGQNRQQSPTQQPPQTPKKPKTRTEIEYKKVKTWDMDQKEEEKKEPQAKEAVQTKQKPIPVLVKIKAKLFDNQLSTDVEFIFFVPIISDTEFAPLVRPAGVRVAYNRPTPPFNSRIYG